MVMLGPKLQRKNNKKIKFSKLKLSNLVLRRKTNIPLMASWAKYLTSMSESVASFSSTGFTSVWRALKQTKSIVYERFHFIVKDALRLADVLAVEDRANLLQGLGHIEADISHLVVGHLQDHGQHLLCGDLLTACFWQSLRHRGKKEVSNTLMEQLSR